MKVPERAFILAAGVGSRMRPLTDTMPKPMLEIGGRSIINHILDEMQEAGVGRVGVNLHHMADEMRAHLSRRTSPRIDVYEEPELLDTGGGLKNMIAGFSGDDAVLCVNGDSYWTDGPSGNVFTRLAKIWDPARMDMLSLLQPLADMKLTTPVGDYDLLDDGLVRRSLEKKGAHIWTNIRICRADLFVGTPPVGTKFSFLKLMDLAQEQGRHFGVVHDGAWHNINTPQDYNAVNRDLAGKTA